MVIFFITLTSGVIDIVVRFIFFDNTLALIFVADFDSFDCINSWIHEESVE